MVMDKEDRKTIVKMSKEVIAQSKIEIKRFMEALKRAEVNMETASAIVEKFK